MKRNILALCVVFMMSAGGSLVFAAHEILDVDKPSPTGALQVYGAAKLSVDVIDTGNNAAGADKTVSRVSSNSSRLGFKGAEELSEGLTAVYQLELGFNMDGTTQKTVESISSATTDTATGATTVTTKDANVNTIGLRNSYIGFKSNDLGVVLFGTHDTPYKAATGQFDPFADTMGDYNAIIGTVNGSTIFELRPKDVIAYSSPVWAGLQFSAATSQSGSEAENATADARLASASAVYKSGPLAIAAAYEIHKNGVGDGDKSGKMKNEGVRVGAGYTLGGTKIGVTYEMLKDDTEDTAFSRNAVNVSLTQKIGSVAIKLAFGIADDGDDPLTETGATMAAVGIDHSFSKRTAAYLVYAAMKNDKDASYGVGQGGAGGAYKPAAGKDPSVISFGINHTF